jgi:hypothetical protein
MALSFVPSLALQKVPTQFASLCGWVWCRFEVATTRPGPATVAASILGLLQSPFDSFLSVGRASFRSGMVLAMTQDDTQHH